MRPDIDVVLVGYRSERFLPRLMEELGSLGGMTNQILYHDNTRNEHSLSWLWNNLAAKGTAEYLCILNPDVVLSPDWDVKLVGALSDEVGVALADNRLVGGDIPRPEHMVAWAGPPVVEIHRRGTDLKGLHFYCPIMKRATWERLHGVDERLRFYHQDCEFLSRLHLVLGQKPAIVRGALVWHYGGASTNEARVRNEMDSDAEGRFSDREWNEIRIGRAKEWHLLDAEEKAAIRRDPRYMRMGGTPPGKMKVHIIPRR